MAAEDTRRLSFSENLAVFKVVSQTQEHPDQLRGQPVLGLLLGPPCGMR